jgi:hypothetical protein
MASQVICSSPRAIDPAPQKRLTLDMLKRALAVLTKRNEGGAGTEAAPPPEPLVALFPPPPPPPMPWPPLAPALPVPPGDKADLETIPPPLPV